jgi:hypothetical protein
VHRAAHALAYPLALGPDLGHHRPHVAALGEEMAMTPMSRGGVVTRAEVRAHTGGDGLLPDVQVNGPRQLARGAVVPQALVDAPDQHHGLIQPERFRRGRLSPATTVCPRRTVPCRRHPASSCSPAVSPTRPASHRMHDPTIGRSHNCEHAALYSVHGRQSPASVRNTQRQQPERRCGYSRRPWFFTASAATAAASWSR